MSIRYEDGAWPLWRWDQGIRYGLKSFFHDKSSTPENEAHFAQVFDHLQRRKALENEPTLKLTAVGDIMWIPRGWDEPMTSDLETHLRGADLCLGNLETPVASGRKIPRFTYAKFNAPTSLLRRWRTQIGRSVFSLCNNHALDQGIDGLKSSRQNILDEDHLPLGGETLADAVSIVSINGVRIGIIGFTYGLNPWGHGLKPSSYPPGLPIVRLGSEVHSPKWSLIDELFQEVNKAQVDLIVVMPHWGFEFEYWPTEKQRQHAYELIRRGADIVLGSSPHVLQPTEMVSVNQHDKTCPTQISRPGMPRDGLIAYSLGNFLSSMPTLACNTGATMDVDIHLAADGQLKLWANARVTRSRYVKGKRQTSFAGRADLRAIEHGRKILGPLVR